MKSRFLRFACIVLLIFSGRFLKGEGVVSTRAPQSGESSDHVAATDSSLPTKPFTIINSDTLDFDYEKHIATFEGNVVAIDPKLTLKCKMMKVFFGKKDGDVVRVEAYSDVHMFHEGKEGVGDKAVFTKETGLIVLAGTKPKLKDEKGSWILSRGDGIIYNVHTKQMHVDKPTLEIQSSSDADFTKPSTPK